MSSTKANMNKLAKLNGKYHIKEAEELAKSLELLRLDPAEMTKAQKKKMNKVNRKCAETEKKRLKVVRQIEAEKHLALAAGEDVTFDELIISQHMINKTFRKFPKNITKEILARQPMVPAWLHIDQDDHPHAGLLLLADAIEVLEMGTDV